jgi:hypothetical protein
LLEAHRDRAIDAERLHHVGGLLEGFARLAVREVRRRGGHDLRQALRGRVIELLDVERVQELAIGRRADLCG